MTASGIFDNEASSVDLKVYDDLKILGWSRESKTPLYQPKYDLSPGEQTDFPGGKSISPTLCCKTTPHCSTSDGRAGLEVENLLA